MRRWQEYATAEAGSTVGDDAGEQPLVGGQFSSDVRSGPGGAAAERGGVGDGLHIEVRRWVGWGGVEVGWGEVG